MFTCAQVPTLDELEALAARERFAVSAVADDGVAEIVVNGLTFLCEGLGGGVTCDADTGRHQLGLTDGDIPPDAECLSIRAGPHIASGAGLPPVVRSQIDLALRFLDLDCLLAVGWSPSATWFAPSLFARLATTWLEGGPFPAPGLVALEITDHALSTRGLAYLCGRELRIPPLGGFDDRDRARLAVRLISELAEAVPLRQTAHVAAADGALFRLEPDGASPIITVTGPVAGREE